MKNIKFHFFLSLLVLALFSSCNDDDEVTTDDTDDDTTTTEVTPTAAFDDFNSSAVTVSFSGDEITITSTGLPNHTSPYWDETEALYIDPVVATAERMSVGIITEQSYTLTVPTNPEIASSSTETGLGAIGISVTGAPIYNDQESANSSLDDGVASGMDYAGGHIGPSGYHYHLESSDVTENTVLSVDDDALIGIMSDGFLIYGRKCNSTGTYPTDLDESGGHTHATQHSDGEAFYHYHVINEVYLDSYILLFAVDLQGTPNVIM